MSSRLILIKNLFLSSAFVFSCIALTGNADETKKINPNFNYLLDGQVVNGWALQLSDPENWYVPITDRTGKSASGKLTVEPSDAQAKGDAIKLVWSPRKPLKATVGLYGSAIDLTSLENDGALVIDLKVLVAPDKDVTLAMDCGYPCSGELHIRKNIADLKKGEWTSLPIPLNCFSKEGADFKKINGPLKLGTDGKLTVEIANVRLQKLADGDKGCAK